MSEAPDPAGFPDEAVWHPCPTDPACPHCGGAAPGTAAALDWSFLDAAYCISLKIRDDRAAQAAAEFHKVGLCQRVLFYRPTSIRRAASSAAGNPIVPSRCMRSRAAPRGP